MERVRTEHRAHKQVSTRIGQVIEVLLFVTAGTLYMRIAFALGLGVQDGGPDEMMRALIPRCIINGNLLPSGYDSCAIYNLGNWSYAFYPQMLAGYVSALFMSIAKMFGLSASLIFTSGRFASVLFGLIALFAVDRSIGVIFSARNNVVILRCMAVALLGFWPQFAFLASYMNNDIAALAGVSVLMYALISGLKTGWKPTNSIVLALGIALCGLGYWNSYGFILVGIIIFLISVYLQNAADKKNMVKLIVMAAGISAILVLPWFAVNVIRYHDLIGMSTFRMRYYQWLQDGGQQLQHPYEQGLKSLILYSDFVRDSVQSFVGNFGYMSAPMQYALTFCYFLLIGTGFGLSLAHVKQRWVSVNYRMLMIGAAVASAITVALFLFYTLHTDYQPQGRYVIYLLIPFVLMVIAAVGDTYELRKPLAIAVIVCIAVLYLCVCFYTFRHFAMACNWNGVHWQGAL